jgi:hypothetical protein
MLTTPSWLKFFATLGGAALATCALSVAAFLLIAYLAGAGGPR